MAKGDHDARDTANCGEGQCGICQRDARIAELEDAIEQVLLTQTGGPCDAPGRTLQSRLLEGVSGLCQKVARYRSNEGAWLTRAEVAEASLARARKVVHRYMVAMGPHLSDSWKELLAKECGLEIDESDPYRHPKRPP